MKGKEQTPPGWIYRLLENFLRRDISEGVCGDIYEIHQNRLSRMSKFRADLLFAFDVIPYWRFNYLKNKKSHSSINYRHMIANYFKVGFRNLLHRKVFSSINIFGLAVSMSVCLLIISIILDLKSYDRFHPDKDKIYRIITDETYKGEFSGSSAVAPLILHESLADFSSIEDVSLIRRRLNMDVKYGEKVVAMKGLFADANFFQFFGFKLIEGDPKTCLVQPFSAVISETMKQDLFGDSNPIGEYITLENGGEVKVTGIARTAGIKSHIIFDALVSISSMKILENAKMLRPETSSWTALNNGMVYIKTNENPDNYLLHKLNTIADQHYNGTNYEGTHFRVQPITQIHLGEKLGNQIAPTIPQSIIFYLSLIALIVLILAIFNYTNLTIAQSLTRFKEIGIRKSTGATKGNIFWQFVTEAVLVSIAAWILALGMLQVITPFFKQLLSLKFLAVDLNTNFYVYFYFLAFAIGVGILAGFFPALYMSTQSPVNSLRHKSGKSTSSLNWKRLLIGIQFTIGAVFLVTAILMQKQISYVLNSDYGFDKENVINVPLKNVPFAAFNRDLRSNSNIISVSSGAGVAGLTDGDAFQVKLEGSDERRFLNYLIVDDNFIDHLKLNLIAGKNFEPNPDQKFENQIIINETAAKELGFEPSSSAIGNSIDTGEEDPLQIIGVIKDFNFRNKIFPIQGLGLRYKPNEFYISSIRIKESSESDVIPFIKKTWEKYDPNHVFEFKFYDDQVTYSYFDLIDLSRIIIFFTFLVIIIANLGLLAMTIFWTQGRLKEVGIRKVMGAGTQSIYLLLNKRLVLTMIISFVVATPVSYLLNTLWMDIFAYKVDFGIQIYLIAFGLIFLLAVIISLIPTIKATITNPVNIIRYE